MLDIDAPDSASPNARSPGAHDGPTTFFAFPPVRHISTKVDPDIENSGPSREFCSAGASRGTIVALRVTARLAFDVSYVPWVRLDPISRKSMGGALVVLRWHCWLTLMDENLAQGLRRHGAHSFRDGHLHLGRILLATPCSFTLYFCDVSAWNASEGPG